MSKVFSREKLEEAVKNSTNFSKTFEYLNACKTNYSFLKKKVIEYNIDISHFEKTTIRKRLGLNEILVKGEYCSLSGTVLKNKLYKAGLKQPICEECGQDENWRGKRMSLILDHRDGNRRNSELENLRIICPNCNAILDTHCRKI